MDPTGYPVHPYFIYCSNWVYLVAMNWFSLITVRPEVCVWHFTDINCFIIQAKEMWIQKSKSLFHYSCIIVKHSWFNILKLWRFVVLSRSALLHAGYRVSMSHAKKNSIKTNAPLSVIWVNVFIYCNWKSSECYFLLQLLFYWSVHIILGMQVHAL